MNYIHHIALITPLILVMFACISVDVGNDQGSSNAQYQTQDVGHVCTPQNDTCDFFCLPLSQGDGICIAECLPDHLNMTTSETMMGYSCPDFMKCNQIYDGVSQWSYVCMPNVSCGPLMVKEAVCKDGQLSYCKNDGLLQVDCRIGDPQCEAFKQEYRYDCAQDRLVFDQNQGCAGESIQGRCEGNRVIYCQSVESGLVKHIDCSSQQPCQVVNGKAACTSTEIDPCQGLDELGECRGNQVHWCNPETQQAEVYDCQSDQMQCGWVDDTIGYGCNIEISVTGNSVITGQFLYEKLPVTPQGLGPAIQQSIEGALVQIRSEGTDELLGTGVSDELGKFQIGLEETSGQVYVQILTITPAQYPFELSVRDCPLNQCDQNGYVYAAQTTMMNLAPQVDIGTQLVTQRSGIAGAFNIFHMMYQGGKFAKTTFNRTPPPLIIQWEAGSNTDCQTSCYSPYNGDMIYILGTPADTDEFDDAVLGHEFGHFLEHKFSRSDSPGGAHDGSPTDPRLAWGEGYGTYVGAVMANTSIYIDTFAQGTSVIDIGNTNVKANVSDALGMKQLMSEFLVSEALWTMGIGGHGITALGHDKIFDVLTNYFTSASWRDRGVIGVDLVDFLDGWFCQGHEASTEIRRLMVDHFLFPYDFSSGCQ